MNKKYGIVILIILILAAILIMVYSQHGLKSNTKGFTFAGNTFEAINGFSGVSSQSGKNILLNDGYTELKVGIDNNKRTIGKNSSNGEFKESLSTDGINYIYTSVPESNGNSTTINVYFTKNNVNYNIMASVDQLNYNDQEYMKNLNETIKQIIVTMHKTWFNIYLKNFGDFINLVKNNLYIRYS